MAQVNKPWAIKPAAVAPSSHGPKGCSMRVASAFAMPPALLESEFTAACTRNRPTSAISKARALKAHPAESDHRNLLPSMHVAQREFLAELRPVGDQELTDADPKGQHAHGSNQPASEPLRHQPARPRLRGLIPTLPAAHHAEPRQDCPRRHVCEIDIEETAGTVQHPGSFADVFGVLERLHELPRRIVQQADGEDYQKRSPEWAPADFLESSLRVTRFAAETNRDLQGQQPNGEINRALGEKPKTNDEF